MINNRVIPLPPISFITKNECRRRGTTYQTEHDKVFDYLKNLKLGLWIGAHRASEVVVLMDAAYADKRILNLIHGRGWDFVCALTRNPSVQTVASYQADGHDWKPVEKLFRAVRKQAPWETIRDPRGLGKKQRRKRFRARRLAGYIRNLRGFSVALVSAIKSNGKGRIYLACSNTRVDTRTIVMAYRRRWWIELFHRAIKNNLGMLDAGVAEFDSMVSHVHWVYCAYLLLGEIDGAASLGVEQRQRKVNAWIDSRRYREIIQLCSRYGDKNKIKTHCQEALAVLEAA